MTSPAPAVSNRSEQPGTDRRPLWIVIEVDVGNDCKLVALDEPVLDVDLHQMGGTCRSDVVTGGDEISVTHIEQPMGERCLADVFFEHDCVPHVTGTAGNSLLITVHPADRTSIPEMLSCLDEMGYPARLKRVVRLDDDMFSTAPILCDFGLLTDKQQEALLLAVRRGYYAQPREATLSELAAELNVGKSAVSHRLQAAESKVIRNHLPQSE